MPTQPALVLLGLLALAAWIYGGLRLLRGAHRTATLADVDPSALADRPPSVSVIVPARNEARKVEPALRSLLAQDYPALEVVAVDDRSDDGTGGILERVARERPSLRVLHVEELPEAWLGKTHALQVGADAATGELLLFTDADVMMQPQAVRRAVVRM